MIRVDTSEVKTFRKCPQQWKLSSRNAFHLQPKVRPTHFLTGTVFHEALHKLYLGEPLEHVLDYVQQEAPRADVIKLLNMVEGYAFNVLEDDLKRFEVLDVEHSFDILLPLPNEIHLCGSIDMIVCDPSTDTIYGFEHKTCKTFRPQGFMNLDEQPRVYYRALQFYVDELNEQRPSDKPLRVGGIYLNEVRKLVKKFDHKRTLCKYDEAELDNFFDAFLNTCSDIAFVSLTNTNVVAATPDYFKCQMCDYATICEQYGYRHTTKDEVLEEFIEEFEERKVDHLDEKQEEHPNVDA